MLKSQENREDFMNKCLSIIRTSHIDIVTLLGYCVENSTRALVYDFMSNGSLDRFMWNVTSSSAQGGLDLENLFYIAFGILEGYKTCLKDATHKFCTLI